jgi:hypothetical protein
MRLVTLTLAIQLTLTAVSFATAAPMPPGLDRFVHSWLKGQSADSASVIARPANLGGAGDQWLVYLTDQNWCGSGGCPLLTLEPHGTQWREIGYTPISWPPIKRLAAVHHGYHDLGVRVEGGGILPGYEAALPFNGARYAGNPSVPPARPVRRGEHGVTLIGPDDQSVPLP